MSAFDDVVDKLGELSDSFDGYTSDNDANVQDLSSTSTQHDDDISTLQQGAGQLTFPLTQDTIDLIKSVVSAPAYITGSVSLTAGVASVSNGAVSAGSIIMLTVKAPSGTRGYLSYSAGGGSFTITSTSGAETSTVAYAILN
jgi:hypothetical protein